MEIQQLKADKINLQKQVRSLQTAKSAEPLPAEDDEIMNKLKKNQEQNKIISNAEIKRLKEELCAIKEEDQVIKRKQSLNCWEI